jgi:hypothetical protein
MTDVTIILRTADQTRKAEVALSGSQTGGDVVQAAVDNWSLPKDAEYFLVNTRTAKSIEPAGSLDSQGVKDGDVLEVQPATDAAPSIKWTDKTQATPRAPKVSRVAVVCPNCKASLSLPADRSAAVSCPFCSKSVGSAA